MSAGSNGYSDWRADRDVRRWRSGAVPLFAGVFMLSGCAMTQVRGVDGMVVEQNELYDGEPVTVHATEIPVTTAEEARVRARTALIAHDVDLALYFYVQAVSLDPEDVESFYAIGAIHADRGNAELAARAYAEVVKFEPENALGNQGLGLALFEQREFDAAEPYLQKAVELDSSLWRVYNALGIMADRNEQYDAAIEFYSSAIQIQPTLASVRNNRGYSHYLSGDLQAAKVDFLAALNIDDTYARAWRNLGLVLAREGDYERAISAMTRNQAVELHVALNDVGYIAMLDGNYDVAQQYFERAVVESPRHYQTAQENLTELNRRRNTAPALVAVD